MALATLPWLIPMLITGFGSALESEEFVDILFGYRHAYQLPSRIALSDFLAAMAFAGATAIAFVESCKATMMRETRAGIASVLVLITGAMLVGWFFVEVVPTRLMASAWVWRLVEVWTWVAWILIAGLSADLLAGRDWRWTAISVASTANSLWLFAFNIFSVVKSRLGGGSTMNSPRLFLGLALVVIAVVAMSATALFDVPFVRIPDELRPLVRSVRSAVNLRLPELALVLFGFSVALVIARRKHLAIVAFSALVGGLLLAVVLAADARYDHVLPGDASKYMKRFGRHPSAFTMAETMDACRCEDLLSLTAAARESTPDDSVFLIPWGWQKWRLFSERAAVVDHKAFIYRDAGMKEWYDRYLAIYKGAGYPDDVTQVELRDLSERYGFQYVVLPTGVDMPFTELAASGEWKIVEVGAAP